MKRAFLASLLLFALATVPQADPLAWVNSVRHASGAPALASDMLLSETASRWAVMLAEAGVLSHRGADGSSALNRYRALGGTEAHVGEILGAGPSLGDVEKGWMTSSEHRALALEESWTHVGWGSAAAGVSLRNAPGTSQVVVVMVFCEKLVDGLSIAQEQKSLSVSGRFVTDKAARGLLFFGLDSLPPVDWDGRTRSFRFEVPGPSLEGYLRLGYVTPSGGFALTNAFTLPRDTEFPAGPARSAAPAPSP